MLKVKRWLPAFMTAVLFLFFMQGCGGDPSQKADEQKPTEAKKIRIGFSMGTLREERWQRDRDIFVARAKELGAEVNVQNASEDNDEQVNQVKFLLEQGIDILVIAPHDAEKASAIVQMAKKQGVKVIAYDRLVRNANVDMYISFDNVRVGQIMADHLIDKVPQGNYLIINGAKTDYNCVMFNQGYMSSLKPHIDNGTIKVVSEIWAKDWMPEEAFNCVEQALLNGIEIDGIIAANDSLAGAAIEALAEQRLAGKVPVVGHDADLAGCQRVAEGTQLMTVYKPIQSLAKTAAEMAISMAKNEKVIANSTTYDGKYTVPYYMFEPIPIISENLVQTVVKDGFHRLEDIYRNVPKSQWPSGK